MFYLLIALFVLSLLIAAGASAAFTRRLEVISDHFHFSPGLLSWLAALGANIPNYAASLVAASSGQVGVGIGIILGSNIYNLAVILAVTAFASPTPHGLRLLPQETREVRRVGWFTLAMMLTTVLAVGFFSWSVSPSHSSSTARFASSALLLCNVLTIGLFGALSVVTLRHSSAEPASAKRVIKHGNEAKGVHSRQTWPLLRVLGEMILALALTLGGIMVMVRSGEAAASDIHLSPVILSLVILAIATSLPNTIVAFILARTGRASASVEELFESNGVNATLGIALPLLFWSGLQSDRFLVVLDGPLMLALTALALFSVFRQRVSRAVGFLLFAVYLGWVVLHLMR